MSRFEKSRANNNEWVDEIKYDLCQVLSDRKELVVIFEFDRQPHHGNLEDAILKVLFKGGYLSLNYMKKMYLLFL